MARDTITLARRLLLREIAAADAATIRRIFERERPADVGEALVATITGLAQSATPSRRSPVARLKRLLAQTTFDEQERLWDWARAAANTHLANTDGLSRPLEFVSGALAKSVLDDFAEFGEFASEAAETGDTMLSVTFASSQFPWRSLASDESLKASREYTLKVAPLPFDCDGPARIDVVLHTFRGELISPAGDAAGMFVRDGRSYRVGRQPSGSPVTTEGDALLFRIVAPPNPGTYRLRCSIFAGNVLLQSRIVSVGVDTGAGVTRIIDYRLTGTLPPEMPAPLPQLSLMLNSNGDGTHTLRYYSSRSPRLVGSSTFAGEEVADFINDARDAMSIAAVSNNAYRYAAPDPNRLRNDLRRFALRGFRFYVHMGVKFAGSRRLRDLESSLRAPGGIELAIREGARLLLPIGMIYDHPLSTNLKTYKYCDIAFYAIDHGHNLLETDCFKGVCRYVDADDVICPSGFWGFRHWIAIPMSRSMAATRVPTIAEATRPEVLIGMSTDPRFSNRNAHAERLRTLTDRFLCRYVESRHDLMQAFRTISPHLIYLFCHAGIDANVPWFKVGAVDEAAITGDELYAAGVDWSRTRPLIFLNGCRTASTSPGIAMSLVSQFIEYAFASGVIGTEIAAYESLATQFAESFLSNFFAGKTAAEAVRLSRLDLLRTLNPLGLIYVPFVSSFVTLNTRVAPRAA